MTIRHREQLDIDIRDVGRGSYSTHLGHAFWERGRWRRRRRAFAQVAVVVGVFVLFTVHFFANVRVASAVQVTIFFDRAVPTQRDWISKLRKM